MQEIVEMVEAVQIDNLGSHAARVFSQMDIAEQSRKDYTERIGAFLKWVKKNGLHRGSLLDFKRSLAARDDLSTSRKNGHIVAARLFLRELYRLGYLPHDLSVGVKGFRVTRGHRIEGVSDDEVERIAGYVKALPVTRDSARLRAILALSLLQGLRQIEIVRLDVRDVDLASGTAQVIGKGRDDFQAISLHPRTVEALRAHIRASKRGSGALFSGFSNNSRRLTRRAVYLIISGAFKAVQIEKNPHGCRKWFTTTLLAAYEGDLLAVSHYTRHATVETIRIYDDGVKQRADLPRFYAAMDGVDFG